MTYRFHRKIVWWRVFIVFCLLLIFGVQPTGNASAQTTEILNVTFLDVGQGDSCVISTSNGFDILIDAVPSSAGPAVLIATDNRSAH